MAGRSFRPIGRPPRHGEDGAAHILLQLFYRIVFSRSVSRFTPSEAPYRINSISLRYAFTSFGSIRKMGWYAK